MYRDTIHKGSDNSIDLAIEQGGDLQSASQITRCRLVFHRRGQNDIAVDSISDASAFSFSNQEIVRGQPTRLLTLKLGAKAASLPIPNGLYQIDVYLYDNVNTNGIYWDTIAAEVRS